jgi:hypothetical protein
LTFPVTIIFLPQVVRVSEHLASILSGHLRFFGNDPRCFGLNANILRVRGIDQNQ